MKFYWPLFPSIFNIVKISPWPLIISFRVLRLISEILFWWKFKNYNFLIFSLLIISYISFLWWRDITRESTYDGSHSFLTQQRIKIGILLLIFREVIFFSAFFWTFIHSRLSPTPELGINWPPLLVFPLNPFQIPFLNTLLLVSSGVTITWRHHSLINDGRKSFLRLLITIFLGLYFSYLQGFEYIQSRFSISDSVYGRIFFVATGFHGLHVIIGRIFLIICLIRINSNHFSPKHIIGFEIAIWYWHFVDVIWLFLFRLIYWWGN